MGLNGDAAGIETLLSHHLMPLDSAIVREALAAPVDHQCARVLGVEFGQTPTSSLHRVCYFAALLCDAHAGTYDEVLFAT